MLEKQLSALFKITLEVTMQFYGIDNVIISCALVYKDMC